jgi:uncharacterized protein DUF4232
MNLTTRLSRRIAAGASVAAAAVLLPTAALAASAGPAAPATPAHAPYCVSAHTEVWYGLPSDGALGSSYFQIEITNIGHTTCFLYGYPGVSADDIHGHQVGKPATHGGGRVGATLTPGATAHFVLRVVDAGAIVGCTPVDASVLKIYAPEQSHPKILGFPSQGCAGKSVLSVDSVHPGTGVPGQTIK